MSESGRSKMSKWTIPGFVFSVGLCVGNIFVLAGIAIANAQNQIAPSTFMSWFLFVNMLTIICSFMASFYFHDRLGVDRARSVV